MFGRVFCKSSVSRLKFYLSICTIYGQVFTNTIPLVFSRDSFGDDSDERGVATSGLQLTSLFAVAGVSLLGVVYREDVLR